MRGPADSTLMAAAFVFTSTFVLIMKTASGLPCMKGWTQKRLPAIPACFDMTFSGFSISAEPPKAMERMNDLLLSCIAG